MKVFGSLKELVSLVFRTAGSRETKLDSAQQTGSQTDVTFRLPNLARNDVSPVVAEIVEKDAQQTLKNKTLDSTNVIDSVRLDGAQVRKPGTTSGVATLEFYEDAGPGPVTFETNKISMKAPSSLTNDYSFTLPSSAGPGQAAVLASTAGNGTTTWVRYDSGNTGSALVQRDGSGNFTAGTITANLTGNASGTASNVTGIVLGANGGTGVANTGKTITLGGSLTTSGAFDTTLTATGTTSVTLPTSGTLATTSNKLSAFANTTSAELAGVITDETGSGALVFGTSPSLTTPTVSSPTVRGDLLLQNTAGQAQPTLQLSEDPDNGTDKVTVQAPASLAASYTLTLPADDGNSGQLLSTDGSGVLSWSSALTNPTTTTGDIIYRDSLGALTRLGVGATGTVLKGGTTPSYSAIVNADIDAAAAIAGSKIAPTFTSLVIAPNGTTTQPGIAFSSSSTTGFSRSSSLRLDFITGGTLAGYFSGTTLNVTGNANVGGNVIADSFYTYTGSVSIGSASAGTLVNVSTFADGFYIFTVRQPSAPSNRYMAFFTRNGSTNALYSFGFEAGITITISGDVISAQRTSGSAIATTYAFTKVCP